MTTENESNSTNGNITVETLQDLLIYDDTFLDYFNVFLQLPVFPQPLEYQRLTDSFKILTDRFNSVVACDSPVPFMANEEEHNKLLEWAQKYRLPLFLKTDLFRELKLSKLIIKPLETCASSSRQTFVHGYSKQTNCSSFTTRTPSKYSDLSSKSNTMVKSYGSNNSSGYKKKKTQETSDENYIEIDEDNIPYDSYLRPGSRAISLPIQIKLETWPGDGNSPENIKDSVHPYHKPALMESESQEEDEDLNSSRRQSCKKEIRDEQYYFYRIQSAPLNFDAINFGSVNEEMELSMVEELDAIEGRQKISLQRLKEVLIGTHDGMNEFRKFLSNTAGKCLCDFWLDCEQLKDLSAFRTEEENVDLRNNLLRNLKDRYKLNLTKSAKDQLNEAMKDTDKLHSIFSQAQYDTLRRLRSYWLPRYVIHQESVMRQFKLSDLLYLRLPTFQTDTFSIQSGIFPKLILQAALPYTTNQAELRSMKWKELMCLANIPIMEPSPPKAVGREKSDFSAGILKRSAFQNRLRLALAFDAASGHPFKNYLQNRQLWLLVKNLEFYQEALQFKSIYSRNSDRLLRLSSAWSIVNRFISSTGTQYIEINEKESQNIISAIKKFKASMKNEIFDDLIEFAIKNLQNEWLIYLKEDVKKFMESSLTHFDQDSPPYTIDDVEVTIEGETIVVRRKLIEEEIISKMKTWDQLSKKEKRRRREIALELKRITERERKRVLKAVHDRLKLQETEQRIKTMSKLKFLPTMKSEIEEMESEKLKEDTILSLEQTEIQAEEKAPDIKKSMTNKILLNLFKKYVSDRVDSVGKDAMHSVMLLQELSSYLSIDGSDKATMTRKDMKATTIYRTYLDKAAKKVVPVSTKIRRKLEIDHERPKSPTLRDIQNHVYNSLTEIFSEFWKFETTELGVKSDVLAKMTEKELQIIAENQLTEVSKSAGNKGSNTVAYTKEDKMDFILALQDTCYQPLTLQILYFLNYLIEKGPEDKMNNLEKDLFFYVEVLKLKEICRTTADEEIGKKKIQCISQTFLESIHPPPVQINIPNDVAQKTIRQVQRQMTNKEINVLIFEEVQYICLKNLLPYWAGFKRQWGDPVASHFSPINKYQKIIERRMKIYNDIPIPKADVVTLPLVPKSTNLTTLSYTMNEGVKWKHLTTITGEGPRFFHQPSRCTGI